MVAYLEHLAETHVYPEGKNACVYFEPRVAGRDAPQLSGWGPHCPRWPPGDSVEPVWGLPARLKPKIPKMASRRLCGACLGPSGPVRAHNASDGLREPLWRPFGVSRPGAGPQGPRWLPGSFVEHLWSLPGLAVSQSTLYVLWSYANNSTGWLP
jgi:hypothetical protein